MIHARKAPRGLLASLFVLSLLVGCGGGAGQTAGEAEPSEESAVIEISPEAEAILAKADLADGKEDHVVEKCASCNLAMDGKPEHALQVGEYEMHFCSDTCSRRFQKNTEALILGLPES